MKFADVVSEVWASDTLAQGFDERTTARWGDNSGWTGLAYCALIQTPCIDLTTTAWFDEGMLGPDVESWPATVDNWLRDVRMHHAFQLPAEWLGITRGKNGRSPH